MLVEFLMSENQLTVVLGMHRSGTSLVTSFVEAMGFMCGKYPMKPSKDNPNGYWEDEKIVAINDNLLASLGYYWYSLVWITPARLKQSDRYEALRTEAISYLSELFAGHKKVALKDPRMCILLPFWVEVFSAIEADVNIVLVKRNAESTASSLVKRDHLDYEYASQLIYLHWASIVQFLPSSYERFLIQYEDVKHNEKAVRESLMLYLDVVSCVQRLLFENDLEHHAVTTEPNYGFCWQGKMLRDFPNAEVDESRIKSLKHFYHALNVAYLHPMHQKYVINEIKTIADIFKYERVVLYGASELTSLLIGQLSDSIVIAVDRAATEEQDVKRYGFVFQPPPNIAEVKHDVILVGVTGRQSEVSSYLRQLSSKPIVFMETLLFKP